MRSHQKSHRNAIKLRVYVHQFCPSTFNPKQQFSSSSNSGFIFLLADFLFNFWKILLSPRKISENRFVLEHFHRYAVQLIDAPSEMSVPCSLLERFNLNTDMPSSKITMNWHEISHWENIVLSEISYTLLILTSHTDTPLKNACSYLVVCSALERLKHKLATAL